MANAWRNFSTIVFPRSKRDKQLKQAFKLLIGKPPGNLNLYKLALTHASSGQNFRKDFKTSNERLEYLGDAILSAVVAEFLFKRYPFKDEGFLTEVRSRLVSRETLNQIGKKLGVIQLIQIQGGLNNRQIYSSIFGNTLEAILGAIYLDKGFKFVNRFIVQKLILPNFDLAELARSTSNYKSMLIEWGQANDVSVSFEIIDMKQNKKFKEFTAQVFLDGEAAMTGHGPNKKKAEQNAAWKTLEDMKLI